MSCFVQYCPPKVEGRDWTDADRDGFAETVVSQIADYSPGFRDRIVHMEVRTPRELEAEVGLTEGNIFQGELTFDQLLCSTGRYPAAPIPLTSRWPLYVRLVHPSGRRRHGRARPQRRGRIPARSLPRHEAYEPGP
jgi:hypothetical protein